VQTPSGGAPVIFKKGHPYNVRVKGFSMFGTELIQFGYRGQQTSCFEAARMRGWSGHDRSLSQVGRGKAASRNGRLRVDQGQMYEF
jgi:hypothetical protein